MDTTLLNYTQVCRLCPQAQALLHRIKDRVVVVGSVARGNLNPKDLDLLWDIDSDRAREQIEKAIKNLFLEFQSNIGGQWCVHFITGLSVDIIPIHMGWSYREMRKRSIEAVFAHELILRVGRPEDCPPFVKKEVSDEKSIQTIQLG